MEVKFTEKCMNVELATFIIGSWVNYINLHGQAGSYFPDFNNCKIAWIEDNSGPISACVYATFDDYAWIYFGTTMQGLRHQGLYTKVIDALSLKLKETPHIKYIRGGIRTENLEMQEVAKKQGRRVISSTWSKEI